MTTQWLARALEESRARGFLGPGAIEPQIAHAEGFAKGWEERFPAPPLDFLDLGSGGGLPGLVLLQRWSTHGVLLDSMVKRCGLLQEIVARSDAPGKCEVVVGRAEQVARWPEMEGQFDLVTARSFGPPAVTAECAIRFLRIGGVLIVSEPPDDSDHSRWPLDALDEFGLQSVGRHRYGAAYHILVKVSPTPPLYPRAIGIPGKRPVF